MSGADGGGSVAGDGGGGLTGGAEGSGSVTGAGGSGSVAGDGGGGLTGGAGGGGLTGGAEGGRPIGGAGDVEGLLRRALAPVDPPEGLSARVRSTLQSIREVAAEELEGWELASMRDPRNWVRPAIAMVGGAAAAAGLLLLGLQQRRRSRRDSREAAERAADVPTTARKIFGPR